LPAPIKLDGDAIRIKVKTDKPRADVGVYVARTGVGIATRGRPT
jgi:hypothetical protein